MISLTVLFALLAAPIVIVAILSSLGVTPKHVMMFVATMFIVMLGGSFILALL